VDFVSADIGKIILQVSKKENNIVFSVEDNGTGIQQDKADNLFK
jgi:signal transduction histidine kinase